MSQHVEDLEMKPTGSISHVESEFMDKGNHKVAAVLQDTKHRHDPALDLLKEEREEMTEQESRLVARKIDWQILPLLFWVYLLQILDKNCVGYGATFDLQTEAHLVGNDYSVISSSGFWAQLAWQPFSTLLIVKVPTRILVPVLVGCWGTAMLGLAFSTNYGSLLANRFLLGLFEAGCLPLFGIITATWYRRAEQPLRVAIWYCGSGTATIFGSLLAWALSFVTDSPLYVYQILFLTVGLLTVLTAPILYWRLDNNPAEARFLTEQERRWAVERLRENNTGIENKEIKWGQILEGLISPAIWLWFAVDTCINIGAGTTTTFGPLIIKGIVGSDSRKAILFNMPFGFLQMVSIVVAAWLAARFRSKGFIILALLVPCIVGAGMLYGLGRGTQYEGPLLFAYYILAPLYGCIPLVLAWMMANTAGHSKKALAVSVYQGAGAVGNMIAPLLFTSDQAPYYYRGLTAVLGVFVAAGGGTGLILGLLKFMNIRKEKQRVKNGKPAKLDDLSMNQKYQARVMESDGQRLGDNAFLDMTDYKNDEFTYTY